MTVTLIKTTPLGKDAQYIPQDAQSAAKLDQLRTEYNSGDDIDRIKYLLNLHGDDLVILK